MENEIVLLATEVEVTNQAPIQSEGKLFTSGAEGLNIPESYVLAESKTWSYANPYEKKATDGTPIFTIYDLKFTIVRAVIPTGGYKCYMTLSGYWTTFGWGTNRNIPASFLDILVDVKNSAGGVILAWPIDDIAIGCRWNRQSMTFSNDFDPDIYDIIAYASVIFKNTTFRPC